MDPSPRRILVVDDDPTITSFVTYILEFQHLYQVRGLNDPFKAIELARTFNPDLILLDIMMPGMDGGELAERLAKDPQLCSVPLIFLSAVVSKGDPETVRKPNSKHVYLPKPVDPNELLNCVKNSLTQ